MKHSIAAIRSPGSAGFVARTVGGLALAAVLLAVAGCGGGSNRVAGKVTVDGVPVKAGVVTFIGAGNEQKVGNIGPNGDYVIEDPPVGTVRVMVRSMTPVLTTPKGARPAGKAALNLPSPPGTGDLPRKYANPDNGLTFTVTGGRQSFDIELAP